jgi:hypothetical protein
VGDDADDQIVQRSILTIIENQCTVEAIWAYFVANLHNLYGLHLQADEKTSRSGLKFGEGLAGFPGFPNGVPKSKNLQDRQGFGSVVSHSHAMVCEIFFVANISAGVIQ